MTPSLASYTASQGGAYGPTLVRAVPHRKQTVRPGRTPMRRSHRFRVALAATAALAVLSTAPVASADGSRSGTQGAKPLTYAIIGDTPYGQPQIDNFPNDVAEINADPNVRLAVHLGDIKNGSSRCDTTYFEQIRADFDQFQDPLVYTPGDNEWTDCHRANNGAYTPTERLDTLREIFFDHPGRSLGLHPRRLDAQRRPYVENVAWSQRAVQFATLHVVGSNNDWLPWLDATTPGQAQVEEYTRRNAADLSWLARVFEVARAHHAKAVVLAIQADLWDPAFSGPNDNPAQYDHFTDLVQALAGHVRAFGGPVLLLNGDSYEFTDDHPLADPARPWQKAMYGLTRDVPNLRRITVNGSTTPCHEWLRLSIDPRASGVFSAERVRFHNQPGFDPAVCPPS
jgi:hypothetical protein